MAPTSLHISKLQCAVLLCIGAPPILVHLLDFLAQSQSETFRDLDSCEFFCGVASIVSGFRSLGATSQGYDISQDSVLQDLGLFFGFLKALLNVLRIKPRGLCWLAIPCNSFGWMAFSQHLRQWCNPYGCPLRPWVWQGNLLCSRACLLIAVAVCRGVTWFVENPLQSSIHSWPYLNYLMYNTWLNSRRTSWFMGYYGGFSLKPQLGMSNAIWAGYLNQPVSRDMKKQLKDKAHVQGKQMVKVSIAKGSNKKTVSGGKDLKSSQEYPAPFGVQVATHHLEFMRGDESLPDLAGFIKSDGFQEPPSGCWSYAELMPYLDFVRGAIQSGKFKLDPLVPIQLEPCRHAAELARKRALSG